MCYLGYKWTNVNYPGYKVTNCGYKVAKVCYHGYKAHQQTQQEIRLDCSTFQIYLPTEK